MFDVSASALVVLCRKHLCLGSVRLALQVNNKTLFLVD